MYRVYGKLKSETGYKPFDMKNGVFVTKLIYASIFSRGSIKALKEEIKYLNDSNPAHTFQIRKI